LAGPLARAWLLGAGPDSLPLAVDGRRLRGALSVDGDARLALRLEDTRGTVSRTPTLIELSALPDRAPTVEILAPGPDADLSRDLSQVLEISAADDYGVASLTLRAAKREDTDSLRRALPLGEAAGQPRAALRWRWDLGADWELFPGDVVEYSLDVTDTRPGTPGWGVSAIQRLRVPSISEIYAEIEEETKPQGPWANCWKRAGACRRTCAAWRRSCAPIRAGLGARAAEGHLRAASA
jgi:hypothetical protein